MVTLKKFFFFSLFVSVTMVPECTLAQGQKFVFAEGLGGGLLASANFDMRFKKEAREGFGARIGYTNVGLYGIDEWISVVPLGINYLLC